MDKHSAANGEDHSGHAAVYFLFLMESPSEESEKLMNIKA